MAKKPIDVNALLGNLLGNLDKGIPLEQVGKKPKKKKEKTLLDEAIATPRLNKSSLRSVRIVMLVNEVTCECCGGVVKYANKHVLCEKIDKHGNKLQTRFMDEEDLKLPREFVVRKSTSANCVECFMEGEIKEVISQEAAASLEPVSEHEIDELLEVVFGDNDDER